MTIGTIALAEVMKKGQPVEEEQAVKTATEVWFIFNSPLNPEDAGYEDALQDEENYSSTNSSTPPNVCDEGEDKVCAIKTTPKSGDEDHPDPDQLEILLPEMIDQNPDPNIVLLKPLD